MFCLGLLFWFCFWFRIVPFPSLHTKAVELFRSQWKGTGLTPGLMSWCVEYLYVSLTWTAGILEICCSLREKKILCDISYFGSQDDFESLSQECPPRLSYGPFKDFFPEFLWKDWDALIDWKADFDSVLTVAITETVGGPKTSLTILTFTFHFAFPTYKKKQKILNYPI